MSRPVAAILRFAGHWPTLAVGFAVLALDSAWVAGAWFVASRLAYVLFAGASLRRQERRGGGGGEAAWERFGARASWLMDNDAVAFVALTAVTGGRSLLGMSWPASIAAGAVLASVGIGVKVWAASSLSVGSYHWRDFFVAPEPRAPAAAGPYRWLSNPMYTLGYAHAWGLAIGLQSPAGLVAAAFAQASILALHVLVERPHFRRLCAERGRSTASGGVGRFARAAPPPVDPRAARGSGGVAERGAVPGPSAATALPRSRRRESAPPPTRTA